MTRRPPMQREDGQAHSAAPDGPDSLLCWPTRNTGAMVQQPRPDTRPPVAEVLYERYAGRLPATLQALAGPQHGLVDLPLHIAWSGLRTYDLDQPRQRMSLYRTVLAEGQRDDLTCFLNRDLLLAQWPTMRTMISRHVREAWETAFPDLGRLASGTA